MQNRNYKPEIDGLRALAILLVVTYHFFPSRLVAGFIGVDVFFVISGFVISRLILLELESKQFSYIQFYKKRIIRIFPALLLVMTFCLCVGWLTLFQDELYQLAKHVLSGVFFYSNFTLLNEVNYFDDSANHKILLNLWSLAIEEQFYILWPILLVLLARRSSYWLIGSTLLVICLSFWFNLSAINQLTEKAFYLPTSRVWELLIGAVVAISEQKFTQLNLLNNTSALLRRGIIGGLGIFVIILSAILLSPNKAYPGYWALLPTLASACIIYQILTFPEKICIFRHPMLVSIGKISYPLYLWHWPLLAFSNIFHLNSWYWQIATLITSFLFSYLTYAYIEYPVRFLIKSSKRAFYLIFAMGFLALISIILMLSEGASRRMANQYFLPYQKAQHETLMHSCKGMISLINSLCVKSNPNTKAEVVILGDSHAAALYIGFANNLKQQGLNLLHLGRIGCPYLPGVDWSKKKEASCAQYPDIKNAYLYILNNPDIKHVVLAMRWKNYANDSIGRFRSIKDPTLVGEKLLLKTLNKTIDMLTKAGKKVYIVQTVPDVDIKNCIERPWLPSAHNCNIDMVQYLKDNATTESLIKQVLSAHPDVTYYSTIKQICEDNKHCSILHQQKFLYKDSNHLSEYGAQVVTKDLAEKIDRAH